MIDQRHWDLPANCPPRTPRPILALTIGIGVALTAPAYAQETDAAANEKPLCWRGSPVPLAELHYPLAGAVRNAQVLTDGRLVFTSPAHAIAVVNRDGRDLWRVSAKERAVSSGIVNDTLWYLGGSSSTFALYSIDGVKLGEHVAQSVRADVVGPVLMPDAWLGGSRWIASSRPSAQSIAEDRVRYRTFVATGPNAQPDFLADIDVNGSALMLQDSMTGGALIMAQPFSAASFWHVLPDGNGIRIIDRDASVSSFLRIHDIKVDGDTVASVAVPMAPVALADSTVRRVLDSLVTIVKLRPNWAVLGSDSLMALLTSRLYRPAAHPLVDLSVVGPDGATWLRRVAPGSPFERWLVISRTGKPTAEVHVPPGERLLAAGTNQFWSAPKDRSHTILRARAMEPSDRCQP